MLAHLVFHCQNIWHLAYFCLCHCFILNRKEMACQISVHHLSSYIIQISNKLKYSLFLDNFQLPKQPFIVHIYILYVCTWIMTYSHYYDNLRSWIPRVIGGYSQLWIKLGSKVIVQWQARILRGAGGPDPS